jgi:hypothetical protein
MNEGFISQSLLGLPFFIMLYLFIWKVKKDKEYQNDERWQSIQLKATKAASNLLFLLLVLMIAFDAISYFANIKFTITSEVLYRLVTLFIQCHLILETILLRVYDKRL